ncbi:MAG TPA: hypothetical protein VM120_05110 [Bryobacteraceae bacterium]|nr:hypothetical protein [Bryobacteraceae bacterium]
MPDISAAVFLIHHVGPSSTIGSEANNSSRKSSLNLKVAAACVGAADFVPDFEQFAEMSAAFQQGQSEDLFHVQ